jgi:signal transduction histidine kinase
VDSSRQFDAVAAEAAGRLASSPEAGLDEALWDCLRTFVEFFGFDRGTLISLSPGDRGLRVSHAWWREGVPPVEVGASIDAQLPWYARQMRRGHILCLRRVGDLPAEAAIEREFVLSIGLKSHVSIPLMVGGSVFGVMTFGSFDQQRRWPRGLVVKLRLAGVILGLGLHHARCRDELAALAESLGRRAAEGDHGEARHTQQLRRLAAHLIQTECQERCRMSDVLHEDVMQILTAVAMYISPAMGGTPGERSTEISKATGMLREAIGKLRDLAKNIRPPGLQEGGIVPGIKLLASQVQSLHGLTVECRVGDDVEPIPEDARLLLCQSARELLDNVAEHAHVGQATVDVRRIDQERVQLLVSDQGKGFDVSRLQDLPSHQFGLFSIYERSQLLGGTFEIASAEGAGTQAALTIPA